jgi:hypothetical protein
MVLIPIVALSFADRDELVFDDMDIDRTDSELHDGWEDIEGDAGLYVPPPGEEGMLHSHAGGEMAFQQIFDSIHSQYVFFLFLFLFFFLFYNISYRKRGDPRTRTDRVQQRVDAWRQQLPLLVDAYLSWNCTKPESRTSAPFPSWKIKVLDFYREHPPS